MVKIIPSVVMNLPVFAIWIPLRMHVPSPPLDEVDLTPLHNPHKVAFAKDANALAPCHQLFGFAVLGTLFMTGEPAQVLIAYNQERCMSCHVCIHLTACKRGGISFLTTGKGQCARKNQHFAIEWPVRISITS